MEQVQEKPQEKPKAQETQKQDARALVAVEYPEETGLVRSINALWDANDTRLYRVNFYDNDQQKFIHTHFVMVLDGKVKEIKDDPKKTKFRF